MTSATPIDDRSPLWKDVLMETESRFLDRERLCVPDTDIDDHTNIDDTETIPNIPNADSCVYHTYTAYMIILKYDDTELLLRVMMIQLPLWVIILSRIIPSHIRLQDVLSELYACQRVTA